MSPIHISVVAAFLDSGRRNAGTPLEIASTPVSATAPELKPLRIRKRPSVPPNSRVPPASSNAFGSNGTWPRCPKKALVEPVADQHREDHDVDVGRHREDPARLLDPAQVRDRDERDEEQRDLDAVVGEISQRRDREDRGDAGGDRHRDGEDVVDEQRRAGDERRHLAEVLAAHDVGAATARVGEDRLAVRRDDDREDQRDRDRDRDERVRDPARGSTCPAR